MGSVSETDLPLVVRRSSVGSEERSLVARDCGVEHSLDLRRLQRVGRPRQKAEEKQQQTFRQAQSQLQIPSCWLVEPERRDSRALLDLQPLAGTNCNTVPGFGSTTSINIDLANAVQDIGD